jgi:hypothetical protein
MQERHAGLVVGVTEPAYHVHGGYPFSPFSNLVSTYNPVPTIMPRVEPNGAALQPIEDPKLTTGSASMSASLGGPEDYPPELAPTVLSEPVVASKPTEDSPLVAALRCFLNKHPEDAIERLKCFENANQEMLLGLLAMTVRLTEGSLSQANPKEVAVLIDGLNSLIVPLRTTAPLVIDKMCFCQWIGTFGVYEPLPAEHRFREGDKVQIYVELRNFASNEQMLPTGQVQHIIQLASGVEIMDYERKQTIWKGEFQRRGPVADISRTRRNDYFDKYEFHVPHIPPGSYVLRIQVEDQGTKPPRKAEKTLDFHLGNLPVQGS